MFFSLNKCVSVIEFYKKRIIRILPLYYLCILYFFITETFFLKDVPVDPHNLGWLRYIFCMNGIIPSEGYFWSNIGITWTIPVFILFYLIAPLLVRISKSTLLSLLVLAASIGFAFVISRIIPGWLSAFNYLPCFIFGIIVYNSKNEKRHFICILVLSFFVLLFKWVRFDNILSEIVSDIYVVSALFAVTIVLSEHFLIKNSVLSKIFDVLDEHSYTLYLVHGIVFCGIIDKFEISTIPRAFIAILGTMVLSLIVHQFFEKPVQKGLKRIIF